MGTPFDMFSAAAHTKNSYGVIRKNRELLKKVMERQGFVNYEKEWWHFSYTVQNPVRFDKVIKEEALTASHRSSVTVILLVFSARSGRDTCALLGGALDDCRNAGRSELAIQCRK